MEHCLTLHRNLPGFLHRLSAVISNIFAFASSESEDQSYERVLANRKAERVLEEYGNHILRYAYSYVHNMSDAEEILQDTVIQYIKAAPLFDTSDHEKAWLLHVAANISKNRLKYNALRTADELNEQLAGEEKQDLSFVWQAVSSLPVKYREVIHLFYYEGYSTVQIAKILKTNEITIRSHLHRGRQKLKKILQEEYDFDE